MVKGLRSGSDKTTFLTPPPLPHLSFSCWNSHQPVISAPPGTVLVIRRAGDRNFVVGVSNRLALVVAAATCRRDTTGEGRWDWVPLALFPGIITRVTIEPTKLRHNTLIKEHCAFLKTNNNYLLLEALLCALLAAQARTNAFLQAEVIFLFCFGV